MNKSKPMNSSISCDCSVTKTHRDSIIPEFWVELERNGAEVTYKRNYKCGGCGEYPIMKYTLGMRM